MFDLYIMARERGKWLANHPARSGGGVTSDGRHYRCGEDGCNKAIVYSNQTRTGWKHFTPRRRRNRSVTKS